MPHPLLIFSQSDCLIQVFVQICILNGKQCRCRSVGFFRSQLIWIYTVCKCRVYLGSAGQGLRVILFRLCLPSLQLVLVLCGTLECLIILHYSVIFYCLVLCENWAHSIEWLQSFLQLFFFFFFVIITSCGCICLFNPISLFYYYLFR